MHSRCSRLYNVHIVCLFYDILGPSILVSNIKRHAYTFKHHIHEFCLCICTHINYTVFQPLYWRMGMFFPIFSSSNSSGFPEVHLPWGSRLSDKCGTPAFMSLGWLAGKLEIGIYDDLSHGIGWLTHTQKICGWGDSIVQVNTHRWYVTFVVDSFAKWPWSIVATFVLFFRTSLMLNIALLLKLVRSKRQNMLFGNEAEWNKTRVSSARPGRRVIMSRMWVERHQHKL